MPRISEEFQRSAKGSLAEDEDWWSVVADTETGEIWVEHEWHHMNPYKSTVTSEGTEKCPLEQFSNHGERFDQALKKVRGAIKLST